MFKYWFIQIYRADISKINTQTYTSACNCLRPALSNLQAVNIQLGLFIFKVNQPGWFLSFKCLGSAQGLNFRINITMSCFTYYMNSMRPDSWNWCYTSITATINLRFSSNCSPASTSQLEGEALWQMSSQASQAYNELNNSYPMVPGLWSLVVCCPLSSCR